MRTVFFISDRTGITAEAFGNSLLTQFNDIEFKRVNIAFIDTLSKAKHAANQVKKASEADGQPALIFSTQISKEYRQLLINSGGIFFDFFETFISKLEETLGTKSSQTVGLLHSMTDENNTLEISGEQSDKVEISSEEWTKSDTQVTDDTTGTTYDVYSSVDDSATLKIDVDIQTDDF